jgi:hypothetical protein
MKTYMPALAVAFAATFLISPSSLFARGAAEKTDQFPHVIQYELGAFHFATGDQIIITSVRGNRKHIEPGGSYLVQGSYILASADTADLALFCTTRGQSGSTPVQDGQRIRITKGTAEFRLYETNLPDGWLHVSFYPDNGSSHDGVYFGEKGREQTIMRNQNWVQEFVDKLNDNHHNAGDSHISKGNRALLAYLGDPVPPPGNMDQIYDKEHLLKAFTALCRKADFVITKLAVDDSEFPFLVYGTLDGRHILEKDKSLFEEQKGYTYGGSVRGSTGDGATYFAVNMVPPGKYPEDQEKACNRRLMLRLQMLADKAQQAQ